MRDGVIGKIPSFASLVEATDESDHFHIAIELSGYAGTNWTREIWLFPDRFLVVHDTVATRLRLTFELPA